MPQPPIAGIVLAAGRSRRMGEPKPLADVDGETFLERVIGTLAAGGCDPVLAVIPAGQPALTALVERAGARAVGNDDPDSEQVDSLRRGLRALEDEVAAAVVLPVDHPLVAPTTVAALLAAYGNTGAPIVRATLHGLPGHPTLFARGLFDELLGRDLPDGARSVIDAHEAEVQDVDTTDEGVTANIDTPEDYREWLEPGADR